ncbi:MAG TPA: phosphopantetheine-binding protein, partial [Bacteroidia bacterium]|nr:phosphopantetheine-binding protein [Bacteroidia bacterium]
RAVKLVLSSSAETEAGAVDSLGGGLPVCVRWSRWERMAERFGTPAYVYDADEIAARAGTLRSVLPGGGATRLYYSFKANPLPSVAAEARSGGCEADLTSPGEIDAALAAGYDLGRALYGGPGKSEAEYEHALARGIGHFSIESEADLSRLDAAAGRLGVQAKALLRINPQTPPKAKLAMAGVASQFGFEEDFLASEGRRMLASLGANVEIVGFHLYWGTQIGDPEALLASFTKTVETVAELAAGLGIGVDILNFGGGFPWPYAHGGEGPDLSSLREGLDRLRRGSGAVGEAEWWFESGRGVVASCGTLLTRVMEIKQSKDDRQFLILDTGIHHLGGMSGLGRIPRFSVELIVPPGRRDRQTLFVDVVGQLCTPLDCIGKKIEIPRVEAGDLLAIPNVGAYGLTASVTGFLSRPAPAEVLHRGDEVIAAHRLRTGHETLPPRDLTVNTMASPISLEAVEAVVRPHLRFLSAADPLGSGQNLGALGLDSMASIDLLLDLENAFDVSISDDDLTENSFSNLEEIRKLVGG